MTMLVCLESMTEVGKILPHDHTSVSDGLFRIISNTGETK